MGVVHLVIAGLAPRVRVVDLAHELPAHDVRAGGRSLARAAPWLAGVALAVVDPGVGTSRRAVAVEAVDGTGQSRVVLVGPDNGLLVPAARAIGGLGRAAALDDRRWHLDRAGGGETFDGRDVFAPVAAHLASGVDIAQIGSAIEPETLVELTDHHATVGADGTVAAHVRWVDRFGNAQLNLFPAHISGRVVVDARSVASLVPSYQDIPPGAVGLVVDSDGWVSLACYRASVADRLGLREGDAVTLLRVDPQDPRSDGGPSTSVPTRPR